MEAFFLYLISNPYYKNFYLSKNIKLKFKRLYIFLSLCFCYLIVTAQNDLENYYTTKTGTIYLPLGKLSFADTIIDYKVGNPAPIKKYSDAKQALDEPNYLDYKTPSYYSLGCGGQLTVAFLDNGFMNLKGNDLYIFEVGPAKEPATVEISEDGIRWWYAGTITGGKSVLDLNDQKINPNVIFYYMRITDLKSVCNSKSAGADIDAIAAINSVVKLNINADVLFDVAKSHLKPKAEKTLDSISSIIFQIKNATLLIEGHTDSDGTELYNHDLSYNRCYSVQEKLKDLLGNTPNYNFKINAFGESFPKAENNSVENKQLNRRVEITLLPSEAYFKTIK